MMVIITALNAAAPSIVLLCCAQMLLTMLNLSPESIPVLSSTMVFVHCLSAQCCLLPAFQVRNVPVYFAWINRISYFSFATDALVANEFTGLDFIVDASTGMSIPAMSTIPDATKTGLSVGGNVAVLAGIAAGCRLLAWGLLEAMAWSNRI